MRALRYGFILVLALAAVPAAWAQPQLQPAIESSKVVGPYEILYSIVPSTFITEQVATAYKIVRAPDRALVNVSVRKRAGKDSVAQAASVTGTYSNLMQTRQLPFREIRETGAIYYLAEFRHDDQDLLHFKLSVQPDPAQPAQIIEFTRKLFVDK